MFILRILIGTILVIASLSKLLYPYQNFLYEIQAYQLLPSWIETLVAQIFPWAELIAGIFMILGLWTASAIRGTIILFGIFVVVVGQSLLRKLSLESCGCFGGWVHIQPQVMIVFDSLTLLLLVLMLKKLDSAKKFSIDAQFDKV